jgi:hypothetical protein
VSLTGIDSDDVYFVVVSNVQGITNTEMRARVTISGTAQSGASDYSWATLLLKSGTTPGYFASAADTSFFATSYFQNSTTNKTNGLLYLYNFSSTTEYASISVEGTGYYSGSSIENNGVQGGAIYKQTGTARDGINFFSPNGNLLAGTFTLYKVI